MDKEAIMLITGSKFYGGPGFCGAVVCPQTVVKELATNTNVPAGLSSYLCKPDVCSLCGCGYSGGVRLHSVSAR